MTDTDRAAFWIVFAVAGVILLTIRIRANKPTNWFKKGQGTSFNLLLILPFLGVMSKQVGVANFIDGVLGPNSAWLLADIFFIAGVCCGTFWFVFGDKKVGDNPRLAWRWWPRVAMLLVTAAWMIITANIERETWISLERGTIDVGQQPLLLSGRLAYFAYSIWCLGYMSRGFFRLRLEAVKRETYMHLGVAWAAVTLAIASPVIQTAGVFYGMIWPEYLPIVWPKIWQLITPTQVGVAVLTISTVDVGVIRAIIWLDKQRLLWKLTRARQKVLRLRPDLATYLVPLTLVDLPTDSRLLTRVCEFETIKTVLGQGDATFVVPAGGLMPRWARGLLNDERKYLKLGLDRQPVDTYRTIGDSYALARWYISLL